jgi:hypothetical protein
LGGFWSNIARTSSGLDRSKVPGANYGANLDSARMQLIQQRYTQYINEKYNKVGHLFQGRYKAIIIDADEYAGELSRYIHLNPVRAGLANLPEGYHYLFLKCQNCGIKKRLTVVAYPWPIGSILPVEGFGPEPAASSAA